MKTVLTVHLLHSPNEILRVFKAHKTIAFAFARSLISYHFGALERRELVEGARQQFIIHVVAQIAAENSEIVIGPVPKGLILPRLATGYAHRLKAGGRQKKGKGN